MWLQKNSVLLTVAAAAMLAVFLYGRRPASPGYPETEISELADSLRPHLKNLRAISVVDTTHGPDCLRWYRYFLAPTLVRIKPAVADARLLVFLHRDTANSPAEHVLWSMSMHNRIYLLQDLRK